MRLVFGASLLLRANSALWSNPHVSKTIISAFLTDSDSFSFPACGRPSWEVALLEILQIMTIGGDRWATVLLGTIGCALAMLRHLVRIHPNAKAY